MHQVSCCLCVIFFTVITALYTQVRKNYLENLTRTIFNPSGLFAANYMYNNYLNQIFGQEANIRISACKVFQVMEWLQWCLRIYEKMHNYGSIVMVRLVVLSRPEVLASWDIKCTKKREKRRSDRSMKIMKCYRRRDNTLK